MPIILNWPVMWIIKANSQTENMCYGGWYFEGSGLNLDAVTKALANDVSMLNLRIGYFHKGQIVADGITIVYTSDSVLMGY